LLARWAKRNCQVFKARESVREAHFEGDADHGNSQALRLTGVSVSRRSHPRFNSFTEQWMLPVQPNDKSLQAIREDELIAIHSHKKPPSQGGTIVN
jgi:hypothetical protein